MLPLLLYCLCLVTTSFFFFLVHFHFLSPIARLDQRRLTQPAAELQLEKQLQHTKYVTATPRRPMGCQPCPRTRWGADAPGAPLENGTWAWEQRGRELELELLGGRRRQTAGDTDAPTGCRGATGGRRGHGGHWAWGGRPREGLAASAEVLLGGRAPGARRALSPNPPTQRSAAASSTRT